MSLYLLLSHSSPNHPFIQALLEEPPILIKLAQGLTTQSRESHTLRKDTQFLRRLYETAYFLTFFEKVSASERSSIGRSFLRLLSFSYLPMTPLDARHVLVDVAAWLHQKFPDLRSRHELRFIPTLQNLDFLLRYLTPITHSRRLEIDGAIERLVQDHNPLTNVAIMNHLGLLRDSRSPGRLIQENHYSQAFDFFTSSAKVNIAVVDYLKTLQEIDYLALVPETLTIFSRKMISLMEILPSDAGIRASGVDLMKFLSKISHIQEFSHLVEMQEEIHLKLLSLLLWDNERRLILSDFHYIIDRAIDQAKTEASDRPNFGKDADSSILKTIELLVNREQVWKLYHKQTQDVLLKEIEQIRLKTDGQDRLMKASLSSSAPGRLDHFYSPSRLLPLKSARSTSFHF